MSERHADGFGGYKLSSMLLSASRKESHGSLSNSEAVTLSEKEGRPMPWRQQLRGRFEVWIGTGIVLYLASWAVGQMISFESDPVGLPELASVLSVLGTIALAVGIVVLAVSLVVGPMYEELRHGRDG